jgi:hypothetical protein
MAKPVRPLMVNGLDMSVAREFDEPIDTPEQMGRTLLSGIRLQAALIHSFFPSI